MENRVIKVVSPIDGTPAERAGIMAGDLVTHLDGEEIAGLTLQQAVDKMRGPVNTPIVLTVIRKGKDKSLKIKIVRDIIRINPVRFSAEDDVGYVRLTTFNEQTHSSLKKAMAKLKTEIGDKLKGYVLDLRNNPGGLLDQAISVTDAFLDKGTIVQTRGRKSEEAQKSFARPGDLADGKSLVVLINGGSASASEIVAGALQDHRRATIMGTKSFGKGSVQTIIPLGSRGALRLTTARYFTPSNRSIQAKGIDPDVKVEQELPDELKNSDTPPRGESSLRGHLKAENEKESSKAKDEKEGSGSSSYVPRDKEKDVQLARALRFIRGQSGTQRGE